MPRKSLFRSDRIPYHVTARANNREAFHLGLEETWKILGSECHHLNMLFGVEFHALVLMPNHMHILLTTPGEDLGVAMSYLMREVTKRINQRSGRSGRVFGGPYFWTCITYTGYYRNVFKYVYRNPVRAGLTERVEDYPFSSLYGLLGSAHLPLPIYYTRLALEINFPTVNPADILAWLNSPTPGEAEELLKRGLRRTVLDRLKNPRTRKPYPELEQLF